jgi:hypothetical protein
VGGGKEELKKGKKGTVKKESSGVAVKEEVKESSPLKKGAAKKVRGTAVRKEAKEEEAVIHGSSVGRYSTCLWEEAFARGRARRAHDLMDRGHGDNERCCASHTIDVYMLADLELSRE